MNISINGEQKTVPDGANVRLIVDLFKIDAATIVVEHNGTIIPPDSYSNHFPADGDRLEFIRFVGGG